MNRPRVNRPAALAARALLGAALALAPLGCAGEHDTTPVIQRGPAPAYGPTAQRFNQRVERLGRVWGRAAVQIRFTDRDGDRRREQGEGHLTLERPQRVALSVGKLGETLFWLGGDEQRYWWLDLASRPTQASVGRHDGPARLGGLATRLGGLAATISPRDLFALAGIEPLPAAAGSARWSPDGRWLGLETPWANSPGGRRVLWLDPASLEPQAVDLINARGRAVLSSKLSEYEPVDQVGDSRIRPQVPGRVFITHAESDTELRLYLSGLDNQPRRFTPDAFSFERLAAIFAVDRVVDLDQAARADTTDPSPWASPTPAPTRPAPTGKASP